MPVNMTTSILSTLSTVNASPTTNIESSTKSSTMMNGLTATTTGITAIATTPSTTMLFEKDNSGTSVLTSQNIIIFLDRMLADALIYGAIGGGVAIVIIVVIIIIVVVWMRRRKQQVAQGNKNECNCLKIRRF